MAYIGGSEMVVQVSVLYYCDWKLHLGIIFSPNMFVQHLIQVSGIFLWPHMILQYTVW